MSELFEMMDAEIAGELNVDVETYIDIIEKKCNQEERDFIIMSILFENEEDIIEAKSLFKSYLNE